MSKENLLSKIRKSKGYKVHFLDIDNIVDKNYIKSLKKHLMYGSIHAIMYPENKITAVQGSANSHAPAQVVTAPTQRINPHR